MNRETFREYAGGAALFVIIGAIIILILSAGGPSQ